MRSPEPGEVIAAPFRFSAFAPANLIICGGLLWASSASLKASAFWQWINQSYNVGVNHANRSSDSPPPERLAAEGIAALRDRPSPSPWRCNTLVASCKAALGSSSSPCP